ncbi:MAG: hypothetical protein IJA47_03420 [Oscillospiraceae bacterium]|nr:hypothetical protein [Oscillospiraceae bacterium]
MMLNAITGKKDENVLSRYQQMQDEVEKGTAEFVAKDLYDESAVAHAIISGMKYPVQQMVGYDAETDSVFGEKSDALVQSGGQLLAQMGVNYLVPGSGMALMAATAFGSEAENAFMNDASYDEALLSATISAGAEVLTEKLGGISFGGKTLTDAAFSRLSRKMTSKLAKALITTGKVATDMTAEGAEELLSGYMSAIGQQLTYMEDKEIEKLFSKEDALESFIGGVVLGGFGGVTEVAQAKSKGVNPVSGLTKNEEAVVNKVYGDELAQREKSGKLSAGEKTKLYDSVVKNMEQGRISTDTIESVLGGDTYKGYQSLVEQEKALTERQKVLQREIDALQGADNTIGNNRKLQKAESELEEVTEKLKSLDVKSAKSNLFSEVDKLTAKDTKLRESYNERTRRGQAFTADLAKYDAKQQETVKRAVESGILNNTNRTHEFVDLIAKISASKGVSFNFADNAKLKESGFALNGKQVNGFVTADGVTININSAKALNSVVGHEITHVLEGTELYNELQSAITEYAKSKGDYQGRYDALTELYKDIEGADIDAELTADLVGDYLFTDADFVQRLSAEHHNLFQKLFDEIKYLCKLATAGTKEARELEKVKKLFEDAYRTETKNPTNDGGVKYSITEGMTDAERYAELKDKNLAVITETATSEYSVELLPLEALKKKAKSKAEDIIYPLAEKLGITKKQLSHNDVDVEFIFSKNGGLSESLSKQLRYGGNYADFAKAIINLDRVLDSAILIEIHGDKYEGTSRANENLEAVYVLLGAFQDGTSIIPVQMEIKKSSDVGGRLYMTVALTKIEADVLGSTPEEIQTRSLISASIYSLADIVQKINPEDAHFLKYLPDGMLSPAQIEAKREAIAEDNKRIEKYRKEKIDNDYLKSVNRGDMETAQKMVDEAAKAAGYTIKAYHGTTNREEKSSWNTKTRSWDTEYSRITVFKKQYEEQAGHFFNSDMDNAGGYGSDLYSVYLMLKKPFVIDCRGQNYASITFDGKEMDTYEWAAYAKKNRYDGVIFENISDGVGYDDLQHLTTDYVVFDSNRIKSAEPVTYDNKGNVIPLSERFSVTNRDIRYSLSEQDTAQVGDYRITGEDVVLAPTKEDIARMEQGIATAPAALRNDTEELGAPTREDILQMEMERELYGDWRMTDPLDRKVEKLYRMMLREQISEEDYNAQLVKADRQYQQRGSRVEDALERIREAYSTHQAVTADESAVKQKEVEAVLGDRDSFVSKQANALYDEVKGMQKGKRVSNTLSYLLDTLDLSEEHKAESYGSLRTALLNIRDNPNQVVNPNSAVEAAAREMLGREYDSMVEDFANAEGVAKSIYTKMESLRTELENNQSLREQSNADFDSEIARLQAEYEAKKNKNTKAANNILRRIERVQRLKSQVDADYGKRIDRLGRQLENISKPEYKTAMQRKAKMEEYTNLMAELVGDTSTWVDKKMGLSYSTNTIRRNLRDVVRDENGNRDIAKADAIYDELQGKYNHNEAELKRESQRLKAVFQELGLNQAEDTYAHMLGEFQYNPDSKLSQEQLEEYYEKHKNKIDTQKVDEAIQEARKVFDDLIVRVNERLKEQGMRQIPYRKGYFPHFTNPKQTWLHKLFNWKPVDNEIPTSIAGLTEEFNPQRSWQSFDKQRTSDDTDYSLEQGLDSYIHGALDWIYHIEDIQKRRALENYIRYVHSDEGIKKRIDEIRNNESYDADEAQELIDAVYAEARNPLNNFVTDLRTGTNTLANKKSSMDRGMETWTNRKIYSVMTNLNSRINANMVVGSFSSALTNFIPITQSWMEVSPVYSLKGMRDTIKSTIRDDGVVNKSDFLTNRLMNEEKLYQTGWDKVSEKAGFMMEAIDSFTSQTVWRSKYLQNMAEGMSEAEAIKNADQFAENVIAGRSRGNQPTIFDAKNPLTKIFTAFQLEVANQYGYMFKDAPQDAKNKGRLIKGYATAFLGAYAYNALYSSLVGRDAAFDPLSILEDLFRDLFGDDEEEPEEILLNLTDNILEEVPFIGGLMGGGRVPISSAIPYEGDYKTFITDLANGEMSAKEMLKPIWYLAMPVAGGQLKKTTEGLKMFDKDLPVAGSYTESGNLRFPVEEDSIADWLQAALFGQYASKDAREYFDKGWAPLQEKQIEEFAALDIPIADYREIRKQLGKLGTTGEKLAYIHTLDLPVSKKNILANNLTDRKTPIDMADWGKLEEFDYAVQYPEKAQFLIASGVSVEEYNKFDDETKDAYDWAYLNPDKYAVSKTVTDDIVTYRTYTKALSEIKADTDSTGKTVSGSRKKKVVQYINSLDAEYGAKLVLYKMEYPSDDTYNGKIIQYVNGVEGFTFEQKATVLKELGFTITADGRVTWN